jgi:hypothetical protein
MFACALDTTGDAHYSQNRRPNRPKLTGFCQVDAQLFVLLKTTDVLLNKSETGRNDITDETEAGNPSNEL